MNVDLTRFVVTPIPEHIKYRERPCGCCSGHLFYKSSYRCVECKKTLNKRRLNKHQGVAEQ